MLDATRASPARFHSEEPMSTFVPRALAALFGLALVATTLAADARTLRWAGRGDPQTMDPYSQNENLTNNINWHVYDTLVNRDRNLKPVPGLATSWEQVDATTWRFKLRQGVKFHDGTPFTADDVVFSFQRAAEDTSQIRAYSRASGKPRKIDDYTVEFVNEGPNPVEIEHIITIFIMSKSWCEKNKCMKPLDFKNKEEMITSRQANGTGAYILKSREPDVKTVMVKNPDWWGWKEKDNDGNVTELIYTPITNDATRLAALISGDVDLINDPAPQDVPKLSQTPGVKLIEGVEQRIVFLGLDQSRDELLYSNVKGKNPMKDKRVRQALYQAIDIDAIHKSTMRGLSKPTGGLTPSTLHTTPEIEKRLPYDPAAARKLLADAGYPNGFEIQLDCPNNRYVNDERICQAVAAMWSKVGVATKLVTLPRAQYFPKLEKLDTSAYMLGWGGATTDAIFTLQPVLATYSGKGDGDYNYGRYVNTKFDAIVEEIKTDMNAPKRVALIHRALQIIKDEVHIIPLHRQVIPWASRANFDVPHRADNQVFAYRVKVKGAP
jgi:peptide/nickel transport system substrate-binding protein